MKRMEQKYETIVESSSSPANRMLEAQAVCFSDSYCVLVKLEGATNIATYKVRLQSTINWSLKNFVRMLNSFRRTDGL